MKEFLKANAVFGIGSCLIGLLISVLDNFIPNDKAWLHWLIIVTALVLLSALLIFGVYLFRRRKSVTVKADKDKVCALVLENTELKRKINAKTSLSEKRLFAYKIFRNIKAVEEYCLEVAGKNKTDVLMSELFEQIKFLENNTTLLQEEIQNELINIKEILTSIG